MAKFKTRSETLIEVDDDGAFVTVALEEKIANSDEFSEFVIPYALYQLTPNEARQLAAALVESAAECKLSLPGEDSEAN